MYTEESLDTLYEEVKVYEVLDEILKLEDNEDENIDCPFCGSEKFFADNIKKEYACMDCEFHGDAANLIMMVKKITWEKAIEMLAEYFGVEIEEVKPCSNNNLNFLRSHLLKLNDRIQKLEKLESVKNNTVIFRRYEKLN